MTLGKWLERVEACVDVVHRHGHRSATARWSQVFLLVLPPTDWGLKEEFRLFFVQNQVAAYRAKSRKNEFGIL